MSTDVETMLRDTLAIRADELPAADDPWQRFLSTERRHRRTRRLRNGAVAIAAGACAGLFGSGAIPVPTWFPAVTLEQSSSPLLDEPTKGSLGDDADWLAEFKQAVPTLLADNWAGDSDGHWRVGDPDQIKILFAGDVFDSRWVVAVVPLRTGLLRAETTVFFDGPAGAAPRQLQAGGGGGPLTTVTVSSVDVEGGVARVLVLAPAGTRAQVSAKVAYHADGTVGRSWTELPTAPTGEISGEVPAGAAGEVALRIALTGGDYQPEGWSAQFGDSGTDYEAMRALLGQALSGQDKHTDVDLEFLAYEFSQAGLDPKSTVLTVLWTGRIDGQPAVLVAAQPRDGGVLLYSARATPMIDADSGEATTLGWATDLRLLAPADGAYSRPYAWRLRDEGQGLASSRVVVVAPEGADRVELYPADGSTSLVEMDATGVGIAPLDEKQRATAVAYDAEGNLLGETPVPRLETDPTSVPGESAATSVVLADEW